MISKAPQGLPEFTYLADLPVVALRGFLQEVLVLGHLLLVREGDTVDTLQRVVLRVTQEVRG